MKSTIIWFFSLLSALLITVFLFAMVANAGSEYKCLVDLHPKIAMESGIMRLGQSMVRGGETYRVMAECKKPEENKWLQFMDSTDTENRYPSDSGIIDNKCDYVLEIVMYDGILRIVRNYNYDAIVIWAAQYCRDNKIDIRDFIHYAEPVKQIPANTI